MEVGWQQCVSRGQLWGWHCGFAGLVAGEVWFGRSCCAGMRRVCRGLVLKIGQRTGWAAVGAGVATARGSHLTATSDQSRKSGWTAAVRRGSALVRADVMTSVANIASQATYIILGKQVERAEHLVVLDVEGPCSLKVALEGKHRGRLDVELLRRAHLAELLLVLLRRDPGRPPRSAAVVVVRVSVEVLGLLVLTTVVEELRHDYGVC